MKKHLLALLVALVGTAGLVVAQDARPGRPERPGRRPQLVAPTRETPPWPATITTVTRPTFLRTTLEAAAMETLEARQRVLDDQWVRIETIKQQLDRETAAYAKAKKALLDDVEAVTGEVKGRLGLAKDAKLGVTKAPMAVVWTTAE